MEKQINNETSEIIKGGQEFTKQVLILVSVCFSKNYNNSSLKKRLTNKDNKELLDIMAQSLEDTENQMKEVLEKNIKGEKKDA